MSFFDAKIEFKKGGMFELIQKRVANPQKMLSEIGASLTKSSQKRFREQAFDGKTWAPRAVPNIPGILNDLRAGKNPPARRFEPRPVVLDTGKLRGSINFRLVGRTAVEVGTTKSYASAQQYGERQSIEITPTLKDKVREFLRRRPQWGNAMGFLLGVKVRRYTFEIQERQFIGVDKADRAKILKVVVSHLSKPKPPPGVAPL